MSTTVAMRRATYQEESLPEGPTDSQIDTWMSAFPGKSWYLFHNNYWIRRN